MLIFPVVTVSCITGLLVTSAEGGQQKWRVAVSIMTNQKGQMTRPCDQHGSIAWGNNTYR